MLPVVNIPQNIYSENVQFAMTQFSEGHNDSQQNILSATEMKVRELLINERGWIKYLQFSCTSKNSLLKKQLEGHKGKF